MIAQRATQRPNVSTPASFFPMICSLLCCLSLAGGCRLCADCDMEAYPSYGGAWERTVRESGRVGSIFDPGGSRGSDLAARLNSDDVDTKNRERLGSDGDKPDDDAQPSDDEPNAEPDPNADDDTDLDDGLQEMEDRFKGYELQDINYRDPNDGQADWQ
jgi:hypothetical protein